MMQEQRQTKEQKEKMFALLSKRKLIEMLINCNDILSGLHATTGWACPRCGKVHSPYSVICDCPPPSFTMSGTTIDMGTLRIGTYCEKCRNVVCNCAEYEKHKKLANEAIKKLQNGITYTVLSERQIKRLARLFLLNNTGMGEVTQIHVANDAHIKIEYIEYQAIDEKESGTKEVEII